MTSEEAEIKALGYFVIDEQSTLKEQYKLLCNADRMDTCIEGIYYDHNSEHMDANLLHKEVTTIAIMLMDAFINGMKHGAETLDVKSYKTINGEPNED